MRAKLSSSLATLGWMLVATTAGAQAPPGLPDALQGGLITRERAPLPEGVESPESTGTLGLPPVTPEVEDRRDAFGAGPAFFVERFAVEGATVFSPAEIEAVLATWSGRRITSDELLDARDALTSLYRAKGYVTSGAIVPDQEVVDGVVVLRVVEGRVTRVVVEGNAHFAAGYFEARLLSHDSAPLRVDRLQQQLRQLQRDDWIARVDATIDPEPRIGENRLTLRVEERTPWQLGAEIGNTRSAALGEPSGGGRLRRGNGLGWGDELSFAAFGAAGLLDLQLGLSMPINRWDTRLRATGRYSTTRIRERDFRALEIESTALAFQIALVQPVWRTERDDVALELAVDWRQNHSTILGQSFCFELTTTDCARPEIFALRGAAQWIRRSATDVLALRSQLSIGLDFPGASVAAGSSSPDAEFVAWLAQAQWAHVFSERFRGAQIVLRGDLQLASDPLLSLERIAIGGLNTVRGYRENQLVRDQGATLGAELRFPLVRDSLRRPVLSAVPFVDWGRAWNHRGVASRSKSLLGAGVGLVATLPHGVIAEAYWGGQITNVSNAGGGLQDQGIHMRLRFDVP